MYKQCKVATKSSDKGKSFFLELAAKMLAIYKGLGYKGGYFGGVHNIKDFQTIMEMYKGFASDDWKQFYKELQFTKEEDFFLFEKDTTSGITDPEKINPSLFEKGEKTKNVNFKYKVSKNFHQLLFTKDKGLYNTGKKYLQQI